MVYITQYNLWMCYNTLFLVLFRISRENQKVKIIHKYRMVQSNVQWNLKNISITETFYVQWNLKNVYIIIHKLSMYSGTSKELVKASQWNLTKFFVEPQWNLMYTLTSEVAYW